MRDKTRKTKPQVRWDASTGGIEPSVTFEDRFIQQLTAINPDERFIPLLKDYCGRFLLEESVESNKPTPSDYKKTLDDLEQVTSDFIGRLTSLAGHELEALMDSAWYDATKKLPPDIHPLKQLAWTFRQQVRVTKNWLPQTIQTKGRTSTTAPIRDFVSYCRDAMASCGSTAEEIKTNSRDVVEICLIAIGRDDRIKGLHHYLK